MDVEHVSPGSFFHITRDEDAIGTYQGEFHIGPTIRYTDPDADSLPGLLEHNHGRYAQQIRAFSSSDISHLLTDEVDIRLLAYDRDLNGLIAGGAGALSIRPVGGDGIVFFGTELADTVYGLGRLIVDLGAGDDHAAGSAANDIIAGGLGRDELRGAGGSDVLYGGAHDDALDGGGDNDQLFGGGGSDSYHVGIGHGYDIIEDGGGAMDTLALYTGAVASAFDYNWFSREGDDLLVRIPDGAGGWHINVRIKDMGTTAGGIERVELWAGTGTALTNTWDLTALWAGLSGPEAPSPPPTSQPPGVAPETRDDVIILGAGNDEARISGGRDQVDGGDGIDRLVIDYGDATLNVRADLNDAYVGSFGGARSVWIQRIESLTVFGGSGADEMTGGNYEDLFYGGAGNDELDGDDGDDTLDGGSGSDLLIGGTGEDVLTSGAGDDTLYAKEWQNGGLLSADLSADWLDGGAGIDRVGVDLWGETRDVTFLGSQAASDTGFTFVNGTHVRNAEQFTVRTGSGADRVWDGAFDDSFDLGSGDDLAHVSRGRDQVHGGDGIDRLVVDYRDATLNVYASLDDAYVGSINSDRSVWIQWFEALTVFGGSGADEMVGGNYEDLFYGGAGNDELDGDDGDDTIDGGSGNDLLTGGTGEDVLAGGAGDDTLYAKEWQNGGLLSADLSADWLDGGAGIDRVGVDLWGETRDVTFLGSQAASATGFTFVNGTHVRNAEQFTVRTGSGADRVWDGAFDDSFNLGSGDDLAHVSRGRDQADGGDGTDRLVIDYRDATMNVRATLGSAYVGSFNSERSVLIDWFEALTVFGGSGADEMTGGNDEDLFYGGAGNDDLEGDDGDDVLDGGSGDDILNGGDGDDILDGGLGDDLLNGGNGVDTVTFATASTATRVQLARTADQPTGGGARDTITGVENLTGSAFDDDFSGDEGANVLADTLGGDDRFIGAAGNDTLIIERSGGGAATTSLLRGGLDEDVLSFDGHGRYTDTVAFEGQDGNDVISAAGAFKANINAGGGNDTVTVDTLGGSFVVKLGSGSDTLVLAGTG
ncbi:MAG: calcium-binding protein, partial [Brevundimonas sp.]